MSNRRVKLAISFCKKLFNCINYLQLLTEAGVRICSSKSVFLKILQNSQVFSCEYYETFKNTFFREHFRKTTSVLMKVTK